MKMKAKPMLMTLLVMLLWGSLYPAVKLGFKEYQITTTGDILFFAGVRFTISGAVICMWQLLCDRKAFETVKSSMGPVLLSGLFAIVLHYSFNYLGLRYTDSSKTALMKQIGPLLYICFSFLFFKEDKLTIRKLIAAVLGFLGIVVINVDQSSVRLGLGEALILLASLCTMISNVISKRTLQKVYPIAMTGVSQLVGGIIVLMIGFVLGGRMQFSMEQSGLMLYIWMASIVSYCLWFTVVRQENLSKLFIIKFAEPIFACIIGAILLGENIFQMKYFAAFILISGGICLTR